MADEKHTEQFREAVDRKQQADREEQLAKDERGQDEQSVRAKSSGHKKKTADKWNQ